MLEGKGKKNSSLFPIILLKSSGRIAAGIVGWAELPDDDQLYVRGEAAGVPGIIWNFVARIYINNALQDESPQFLAVANEVLEEWK